ncbi:LysR family transcriptional regulator [Paraburkholderia sp. EG286A]|uniref:LysR family transcriptional regulator n=1 Tax=Paraburkholderia sp. EG286A TaxID=3237014 RepID=UPI0034D31F32
MDKIRMLRVFLRVGEAGGITAAANVLDCSVAYVSRVVSELEDDLHARLFDRSTRRIRLTEVGERYFHHCAQILADLDCADAEASDAAKEPTGLLRVHTIAGLGKAHLAACIVDYQRRFPKVEVDLTSSPTLPRLVEEQFDISVIAAKALPDSDYVSQVVATIHGVLVAAPSYLKMRPLLSEGDLAGHACAQLLVPTTSDGWLVLPTDRAPLLDAVSMRLKFTDPEAMRAALRAGAGIGVLPVYCAIDDLRVGMLVRVLPRLQLPPLNVYAVYPSRRYVRATIRTFVDFIKQELSARIASQDAELLLSCCTPAHSHHDDSNGTKAGTESDDGLKAA